MKTLKKFTIDDENKLQKVIDFVLKTIQQQENAYIITLSGELGAGKTTFTQYFGRTLGVSQHITSPTYGILDNYKIETFKNFTRLIHLDVYRLQKMEDLELLDWGVYSKNSNHLICMEWPSQIDFKDADMHIDIAFQDQTETRIITISTK